MKHNNQGEKTSKSEQEREEQKFPERGCLPGAKEKEEDL